MFGGFMVIFISSPLQQVPGSEEELCWGAQRLPRQLKWTILMESGGHFAGAIFSGIILLGCNFTETFFF